MLRDMKNLQSGPGWEPAQVSDPVDGYVDYFEPSASDMPEGGNDRDIASYGQYDYDLKMTRMSRASQDYNKHPLMDFDESSVDDAVKIVELCQEKGISLDDFKKAMEIQEMIEDQNKPSIHDLVKTGPPEFKTTPMNIPEPVPTVVPPSVPVNDVEHKDHGIVGKAAKAFSVMNPIGYKATKTGLAMGKAFGETVKNDMDKNGDGKVSIGEVGRSTLSLTPVGAMADAVLDKVYDDKVVDEQVSMLDTEFPSDDFGSGYDMNMM